MKLSCMLQLDDFNPSSQDNLLQKCSVSPLCCGTSNDTIVFDLSWNVMHGHISIHRYDEGLNSERNWTWCWFPCLFIATHGSRQIGSFLALSRRTSSLHWCYLLLQNCFGVPSQYGLGGQYHEKRPCHTGYIYLFFPQYGSLCGL